VRPLAAAALLCCACSGSTRDPGLDLQLRVRDAQLVRAPLPQGAGGPAVTLVDVRAPRVEPGESGVRLGGRAAADTFALNLGLDREDAYWVLPSGLFDAEVPTELSFEAQLDFSRALAEGPFAVRVQAVNSDGVPGDALNAAFEALPLYPPGALVISLEWDANVDADLYVETPDGVLLGGKNVNTQSSSGAGILDFDSNANCTIDGRRRESAVWSATAPPGRYRVLAALAQTCGLESTRFTVTARASGQPLGAAQGALFASDARNDPTAPTSAPGVLALELELP
jgi:hypothetical protein